MMRPRFNNSTLLRALIKEYSIGYKLPTADTSVMSRSRGSISTELGILSGTGLAALSFLGLGSIFGTEDSPNEKNPLVSFASNVRDADKTLSSGADVLTLESLRALRLRLLFESGETYKTKYGDVSSDLIDPILLGNIRKAQKENYLTMPASIDASTEQKFKAELVTVAAEIRNKIGILVRIVDQTSAVKAQNFPADFTPLGLQLTDVDTLSDLDADPERAAANAAVSDAISTAIFNKMKRQIINFAGSVDEIIKKINASDRPPYEKSFKDFGAEVRKIMTFSSAVESIIVK